MKEISRAINNINNQFMVKKIKEKKGSFNNMDTIVFNNGDVLVNNNNEEENNDIENNKKSEEDSNKITVEKNLHNVNSYSTLNTITDSDSLEIPPDMFREPIKCIKLQIIN